jgi:class 3 adenylate cyclase
MKTRRCATSRRVHLGDIIHDADKTYGDGIKVAARLEPLAEPGGICISATVREGNLFHAVHARGQSSVAKDC